MEELNPMGLLPPNSASQIMISYLGKVVLLAETGLGSRNMSIMTFAVVSTSSTVLD